VDALECLRGSEEHGTLNSPYVIFVDLIMPRMSGLEFLDQLQEIPEAKSAPVFVMSGSSDQDDIFRAYSHDIAGYIVKSDPVKSIRKALELLDYQWHLMKP
jgi:DNA-binding NarL/FixJ family response regulator